jgi:hypothetical protein
MSLVHDHLSVLLGCVPGCKSGLREAFFAKRVLPSLENDHEIRPTPADLDGGGREPW